MYAAVSDRGCGRHPRHSGQLAKKAGVFVRLAYFDEVKYQEGKQPYYWIGGIVVTPEMVWYLENAVSELSKQCFGISTLSKETEFHAAEIFHRKCNFKEWTDIEKRVGVINSLADILNSQENLAKIYVRIEPVRMTSKNAIEDNAFMFFVELVEKYLISQKSPGMLIGDRDSERVSKQFAEKLSQYRADGTSYLPGIKLNHLIDTVHFTHSHHSRMLQLVDLYVWLLQLRENSCSEAYPHKLILKHVKDNTTLFNAQKWKEWPR